MKYAIDHEEDDPELKAALEDLNRLREVRASGLIDSPPEHVFDAVTAQVCDKLKVPISLVTIIDRDRQFFKSCIGLPDDVTQSRGTPIEDSVCQYVVKKRSVILIDDVKNDPSFHCHMGLKNINAGAYLGVPLVHSGEVIGSVCAIDRQPRKWREADIDFLERQAKDLRVEISRHFVW